MKVAVKMAVTENIRSDVVDFIYNSNRVIFYLLSSLVNRMFAVLSSFHSYNRICKTKSGKPFNDTGIIVCEDYFQKIFKEKFI